MSADSELDAALDRLRQQHNQDEADKRRQCDQRELPQRLRDECQRVAAFCHDRLLVGPGRIPDEDDLFEQWAWEWRILHDWLTHAGLGECLEQLEGVDDPATAVVLQWLNKASKPGGLDPLARSIKAAADDLRSVLSALRQLPDRLLPPALATSSSKTAEPAVFDGPSFSPAPLPVTSAIPAAAEPVEASLPDKKRPSQPAEVKLQYFAIALQDGKTWTCFRKHHGSWHESGSFPVANGRETEFLKALLRGGGFLDKMQAIKLVNVHAGGGEAVTIMAEIVKPAMSRLRRKIRIHLKLQDVDPLPWQAEVRGWRAAIVIGYASLEDSPYSGGKQIWVIKTEDQV